METLIPSGFARFSYAHIHNKPAYCVDGISRARAKALQPGTRRACRRATWSASRSSVSASACDFFGRKWRKPRRCGWLRSCVSVSTTLSTGVNKALADSGEAPQARPGRPFARFLRATARFVHAPSVHASADAFPQRRRTPSRVCRIGCLTLPRTSPYNRASQLRSISSGAASRGTQHVGASILSETHVPAALAQSQADARFSRADGVEKRTARACGPPPQGAQAARTAISAGKQRP